MKRTLHLRRGLLRSAPWIAALAFWCCAAQEAWAWGREGHRLTALVAEAYLTPAAGEQVQALLGKQTLADVAPWADEYREDHPETGRWHYDNIPSSAAGYDRARDCPAAPGLDSRWRDCVTDRILYFEQRLGDTSLDRAERAEALKFLVHFVGDLHQPLHTIGDARGGNDLHVKVLGLSCGAGGMCNLHEVWDTELVEDKGLSEKKHLALLLEEIEGNHWQRFAGGDPVSWTNQSHRLGQGALVRDNVVLPPAYMDEEAKVADEELALGGLRLAAVLNRLLGTLPAAPPESGRTPLPSSSPPPAPQE